MSKEYDYLFKLLIIGDMGVGKSSILLRFADNKFLESYITTIGVDFKIRTVEMDGKRIKLQIWDTAGQERFRTITSVYYRGTHGVLIVYDVTNGETFANVKKWLTEVDENCDTIKRVLVGNKVDETKRRIVLRSDAELFAKELHMPHFEISAKTNLGVEKLFETITRQVYEQRKFEEASAQAAIDDETVQLKRKVWRSKSGDCSC